MAVITTLAQNARAVLAYPPALFLEATFERRDVELALGACPLAAIGHEKAREVRADDLGRLETEDLLRRRRSSVATWPSGSSMKMA